MNLLVAQIITVAVMFTVMLSLFLLPFGVLSRKPSAFQGPRYAVGLSLANCLSAGVFLATFFVGLLPEVRHLFAEIQAETNFPVTETVVFGGFFLSLFTEQAAMAYKERGEKRRRLHGGSTGAVNKGVEESRIGPQVRNIRDLVTSSSEPEDDGDFEKAMKTNHHGHHGHSHGAPGQHGHSHAAEWSNILSNQQEGGFRLFVLLVALGIHSIFEGLALGLQRNSQMLFSLFVGVAIHEFLVAFALGVSVAKNKLSTAATVRLGLLFAASIPVGQIIGYIVAISGGQSSSGKLANAVLQGLAAGTFIHVTFMEVIPSEFNENEEDPDHPTPNRFLRLLFLLLGFMLLLGCTVGIQMMPGNLHVH